MEGFTFDPNAECGDRAGHLSGCRRCSSEPRRSAPRPEIGHEKRLPPSRTLPSSPSNPPTSADSETLPEELSVSFMLLFQQRDFD